MSLFDSASVVITPSGYKEDKLYSIKPTDGSGDLVVTRATTATRVNSAGLVEVVPRNLIQQSETFDTTWTKYNSATITNNAIVAPNGTTTADLLISGSAQEIYSANMPKASEELFFTFSCYAKIYNTNVFQMVCSDFATSGTFANFNLSTLTVNVTTGATWSNSSGSITNVGNGWYRCVFTSKSPNTSGLYLSLTTTGTNSVSGVYIWGAQVEQGSTAKEYFPTTDRLNIPRIDYTNGSCPSILVEPQRTNLITYSEDFTNVSWVKADTNVTSNAIVAPDGNTTADYLIPNTTYTLHTASKFTLATAGNNTFSIFAKQGGYKNIFVWFDVHSGGIGINLDTLNVFRNENLVSYKVTPYSNGWVNISITANILVTSNPTIYICDNSATPSAFFSGNGTSGVYFWGGQLEAASYPTSYIPTVASAVTRNADVISKTGISSLIGQTEGSAFVDINLNLSFTEGDMRFITISDGSSSNWYFIGTNNTNEIRFYFRAGATTYVSELVTLTSGRHKLAFAYKNNDYVAYVDGVQIYSTASLSVGSTTSFDLGKSFGSSSVSKQFINSAILWKERLSNDTLATLTTI
jgi:hypothetical protein